MTRVPVVYLHEAGFDRRSARHLPVVRALAGAGARLVIPELPRHGDRRGADGYVADRDRLRVVADTAREMSALLDDLGASRCTVVGGSLGGLCALAAACRDRRVRRVASFLAPLFWPRSWRDAESADLRAFDPGRNLPALLDRDVLLVSAAHDSFSAPPAGHALDAARWTAAGGRLETVTLPDHGHHQSDDLATTIRDWYVHEQ